MPCDAFSNSKATMYPHRHGPGSLRSIGPSFQHLSSHLPMLNCSCSYRFSLSSFSSHFIFVTVIWLYDLLHTYLIFLCLFLYWTGTICHVMLGPLDTSVDVNWPSSSHLFWVAVLWCVWSTGPHQYKIYILAAIIW